jgi:galactokinase
VSKDEFSFRPGSSRLPLTIACAPARVELLGNHTDYNEGLVLGAAINLVICVSGVKDDRSIRLASADFGEVEIHTADLRPLGEGCWANYLLGVANELRNLHVPIRGFTANVSGDLPIGAGLSSSAALEAATALFLLKLFPAKLPRLEIAKACHRAEQRYVGVQSGLLDQVISLFGRAGHAIFFDCRSEEICCVPFPAELALVIAESSKKRELVQVEYNLRRRETHAAAHALGVRALRDVNSAVVDRRRDLSPLLRRRASHVIGENKRVRRALKLLEAGDGVGFGKLMNESHDSSRQNFENSTPELDLLVSIAQDVPGVLGARLTGAGFGGSTVTLCERPRAQQIAAELSKRYGEATGITPRVFVAQIADGAK